MTSNGRTIRPSNSGPVAGFVHSAFSILHSPFSIPRAARAARGQVLVEYAIVFPIQLVLTLGIIQLAHIFVAKQVLEYAAFCGARAALVGLSEEEAKQAAVIPISLIAGPSGVGTADTIRIPGWGRLARSGAAEQKTRLEVRWEERDGGPVVRCVVFHDYELRVPVGDFVAYRLGEVFRGAEDLVPIGKRPHLRLRASCVLALPERPAGWGEEMAAAGWRRGP